MIVNAEHASFPHKAFAKLLNGRLVLYALQYKLLQATRFP